ncbi:hypothetical protein P879_04804 [Paragonimus westermani]|uniref:Uncharacterized protein n=1 Tax=Paragonimus westermani TaxID=34504 RepID=A0A8T0DKS0_9TREM|nr:hypothetical protein P879_04804 [Paragonimus westermani]
MQLVRLSYFRRRHQFIHDNSTIKYYCLHKCHLRSPHSLSLVIFALFVSSGKDRSFPPSRHPQCSTFIFFVDNRQPNFLFPSIISCFDGNSPAGAIPTIGHSAFTFPDIH